MIKKYYKKILISITVLKVFRLISDLIFGRIRISLLPLRLGPVLSKTWPAGQNWPFGVFCWALLRKFFVMVIGPLMALWWPFYYWDAGIHLGRLDWGTVRLYRHSKMSLSYVHCTMYTVRTVSFCTWICFNYLLKFFNKNPIFLNKFQTLIIFQNTVTYLIQNVLHVRKTNFKIS